MMRWRRNSRKLWKNIDAASTITDAWTAHNCSYFGITVHWTNSFSLNCCKAAPALLADTHIMYWLQKLSTFIGSMV